MFVELHWTWSIQYMLSSWSRHLRSDVSLLILLKHSDCYPPLVLTKLGERHDWKKYCSGQRWSFCQFLFLIKCRHTGKGRKIEEINYFSADNINEIRFEFLSHGLLTTFPFLIRLLAWLMRKYSRLHISARHLTGFLNSVTAKSGRFVWSYMYSAA